MPADLPTNIPSTLRSSTEAPISDDRPSRISPGTHIAGNYPDNGAFREESAPSESSWWEKLKHLFSGEHTQADSGFPDKTGEDFGTGVGAEKGDLGPALESEYPYSGAAFESSFVSMGIPNGQARRFAGELRHGGAIVSVNADTQNAEAEAILERNRGTIRYEADAFTPNESWETEKTESGRVQIFGHVQRIYPSGAESDEPIRKAS
jgi:hypothetical protein